MITDIDLTFRLQRTDWYDGYNLWVIHKDPHRHETKICTGVTMKTLDTNELMAPHIDPTCHLSPNSAQALMDDLWAAGVRPTEGAGTAGSMAAVQAHLEDMRTLVFKKGRKR